MSPIIDSVIQTLRLLAQERNISLQCIDLQTLPSIQADEKRLFNLFYNLVTNAIDEVAVGGSITIRGKVESGKPGIYVSVSRYREGHAS